MTESKRTLPDYEDPPVFETVLGVQFLPLASFSTQHYGLYWSQVRDQYPKFVTREALPPAIEEFDPEVLRELPIGVKAFSSPHIRCWFIHQTDTRLFQIQNDRFIYNWRKGQSDEDYPHYENIEPKFKEEWVRFCGFLKTEGLGVPEVNQCEVTYLNHLERGKGWKSYGEINKVLACWSGRSSGVFLPEPEKILISTRFVMPGNKGRLHISMKPALRREDSKEVLILELTARGKPTSSSLEHILEWLQLGHEWIVRGFTDFTAEHMHEIWRRTL